MLGVGLGAANWLVVLVVTPTLSALTHGACVGATRSRRRRIAFVGTREAAQRLAADLERAHASSYRLVGRVAPPGDGDGPVRVVGELGRLREAVLGERIDLLVVGNGMSRIPVFDALAECLDLQVQYTELAAFYEDVFGNVPAAEINIAWFAHLASAGARHPSPAIQTPARSPASYLLTRVLWRRTSGTPVVRHRRPRRGGTCDDRIARRVSQQRSAGTRITLRFTGLVR